ncbi:MAG: RNA-binding S4 domain-containing protein [Bacilli bacterium]|nr:RNA-binding S4 domain-containing protein [Bacilli bacterium]
MKKIVIAGPYITLGQLLKYTDVVSSGGEVKPYLATHKILCNDVLDSRRGRKLYPGDTVKIDGKTELNIVKKNED